MNNPELNNVVLRDVREEDLPVFFAHQLDPEATRMADFPARENAVFMAHWAKILRGETNILKTILFNGEIAGNIVSWEQDGQRFIGYWLGKAYWGKGIATKALVEFLNQVKSRPLYAIVVKHNIGSFRVLEKCGFAVADEDSEEYTLKLG